MTLVLERLFSAYLAFLPWLFLVVGLVLVFVGSAAGRPNRRVVMIGLSVTGVSALWVIIQMLLVGS
jgi:hypothetical protein